MQLFFCKKITKRVGLIISIILLLHIFQGKSGHKNTRVTLDVYAHLLKEKEQSQRELALHFLNVKSPNVPK